MREKLKLKNMKVSFAGSIITNDNHFSQVLRKKIKEKFNDVVIKEPEQPPVMGALLIAKNLVKK